MHDQISCCMFFAGKAGRAQGHAGSVLHITMSHSAVPQLDELQSAIDKAATNPGKFDLTPTELERRQGWLATTRKQVRSQSGNLMLKGSCNQS